MELSRQLDYKHEEEQRKEQKYILRFRINPLDNLSFRCNSNVTESKNQVATSYWTFLTTIASNLEIPHDISN